MRIGLIELKSELKKEIDHIYITTDGKKFVSKDIAEAHQDIIDRLNQYSSETK